MRLAEGSLRIDHESVCRPTISKARQSQTQKEAAAALGVVPSVVSEALAAARYHAVREAENALALLLATFGGNAEFMHGSVKEAK